MNKPLSLSAKLGMLIVLALIFAATLIALSLHERRPVRDYSSAQYGDDERGSSSVNRKFSVKPGGKLVMDVEEGDVNVMGTDGEEVTVKVSESGSRELVANYHLTLISPEVK